MILNKPTIVFLSIFRLKGRLAILPLSKLVISHYNENINKLNYTTVNRDLLALPVLNHFNTPTCTRISKYSSFSDKLSQSTCSMLEIPKVRTNCEEHVLYAYIQTVKH